MGGMKGGPVLGWSAPNGCRRRILLRGVPPGKEGPKVYKRGCLKYLESGRVRIRIHT